MVSIHQQIPQQEIMQQHPPQMNQQSTTDNHSQISHINNLIISSGSHAPWFAPPTSCNGASAASLAASTSNAGSAPTSVHAKPQPEPPRLYSTTTALPCAAPAAEHHHGGEQPKHGDSAAHASTAAPAAEPTHAYDARTASGVLATPTEPADDLHLAAPTNHAPPTPTPGAAPPAPNASRATTAHATTATATNLQLSGLSKIPLASCYAKLLNFDSICKGIYFIL